VSDAVRRVVTFVTIRMGSQRGAAKLLSRFNFEGSENGMVFFSGAFLRSRLYLFFCLLTL